MQDFQYEYLDNRYHILAPLGSHEKKSTWLAQDTVTGQFVVKKYISAENAAIYETLKTIYHKNLVRIFQTAKKKGTPDNTKELPSETRVPYDNSMETPALVIMEYVSGLTIQAYQDDSYRFSEEEVTNYIRQLLEGLEQIHKANIVHRDITPKNLLISTDGVLKILDFDIGRVYKASQGQDTEILGTAGYAAPEQFGFTQSDARTDIYAAGVLINAMLTGALPRERLYSSGKFGNIIQKCTQLDPEKRYQSASELLLEFSAPALINTGSSEHPPISSEADVSPNNDMKILPVQPPLSSEAHAPSGNSREISFGQEPTLSKTRIPSKNNNDLPPESSPNESIWPGFRTGVRWKQVTASTYYILMGIYTSGVIVECAKTIPAAILETIAVFTYVWLAVFLPLNFCHWMERAPVTRRFGRTGRIIFGILLWTFLFCIGYQLDRYVRVDLLHIAPKSNA